VSPRDPARGPAGTPGGPGSLLALQEAMARALIDPAHRGGAALPPPLAGVAPERLAAFARMLEGKRRRRVQEALPASCRLLGAGFAPLFAAYTAEHPPTAAARREEVGAFAAFAAAALRSQPNARPGIPGVALADLLRYEALRHELARQSPPGPVSLAETPDETWLSRRPVLGPAIAVTSFDVAVDRWLEELASDDTSAPVPECVCLLVARFARAPIVRARRVNGATVAFLDRCDGGTAVGRMIEELAQELRVPDPPARALLRAECLGLLRLLCGQGLVTWEV
jgi:hypothetical protein